MSTRRLTAAIVAALLALAMGSCGDDTPTTAATEALPAASSAAS